MAKRPNGTGSIVKLKYRDANGNQTESKNYFIFYTVNGKQKREATGTDDYKTAEEKLKLALAKYALNPAAPDQNDIKALKYEDIRDPYLDKQRKRKVVFAKKADGTEYLRGVPNLDAFFAGRRVLEITERTLTAYEKSRRAAGMAGPTIRRELVSLRAMFNLNKLARTVIPDFDLPPDSEARQGFTEPDVFAKLAAELPENLRPLVQFIYCTGMRKGAALKITWDMLSEDCDVLHIPAEIMKNRKPLTLPLVGDELGKLAAMLKKKFRAVGKPMFDSTNLRKEWSVACAKVGLGKMEKRESEKGWKWESYRGLMLHDLRRSAVRNLVRAGNTEATAMKISGHRSRWVFDRYNIVDTRDVEEALVKQSDYAKIQKRRSGRVQTMPKRAKGNRG